MKQVSGMIDSYRSVETMTKDMPVKITADEALAALRALLNVEYKNLKTNEMFAVFYRTKPTFFENERAAEDWKADDGTYTFVIGMNADNLEDLYIRMQGQNWSPHGEARMLIKHVGLHHTSMSVGDLAWRQSDKTLHECRMIGWEQIA